jgi:hypothetical protein
MRLLTTVVMAVLLLSVGRTTLADTLCLVASTTQDELAKEAVRKCRPGDTLLMGYAQFVPAPDVALVCDLSKPIVLFTSSVLCIFSGMKTLR